MAGKGKRRYTGSAQKRAREHGRGFEYRTARALPGALVYSGQAGDVVWRDWILECKYRLGFKLQRLVELGQWIEQAKRNAEEWRKRGDERRWAIVFTGGGRSGSYVILPLETFLRLAGGLPGDAADPGGAGGGDALDPQGGA